MTLSTQNEKLLTQFQFLYTALSEHVPEAERPAVLLALTESYDLALTLAGAEIAEASQRLFAASAALDALVDQRNVVIGELQFTQREYRTLIRAVERGDITDERVLHLVANVLNAGDEYSTAIYQHEQEAFYRRVTDGIARALGCNNKVAEGLADVLLDDDAYLPEALTTELADLLERIAQTMRGAS
jgi:hypothetical protein